MINGGYICKDRWKMTRQERCEYVLLLMAINQEKEREIRYLGMNDSCYIQNCPLKLQVSPVWVVGMEVGHEHTCQTFTFYLVDLIPEIEKQRFQVHGEQRELHIYICVYTYITCIDKIHICTYVYIKSCTCSDVRSLKS